MEIFLFVNHFLLSTCIILTRRQTDQSSSIGLGPRMDGLWYIKYVYIRCRDQAMQWSEQLWTGSPPLPDW